MMAADGDAGDGMYTAINDKEDLIPGSVAGKGGIILTDGFTGDKSEASPLHKIGSNVQSGKDVTQSRGLRLIIASFVIFSFVITVALILSIYLGTAQVGSSGAVAADVGLCSDQGLAILEKGGNAVDAAVTSMLCVGVVNAESSGIGGGGFMLVHDHKNQESSVFDFREVAPSGGTKDVYKNNPELAKKGGMSVGVPGELKGMETVHKKYGKLSWSEVVRPAADLARSGFKLTKHAADVFKKGKVDIADFTGQLGQLYTKNGQFIEEGTVIKRTDLADTLDVIASQGSNALYDGKLTQSVLNAVNAGLPPDSPWMTKDDLKNYEVKERAVVKGTYHDSTIISVPSPGSGPVVVSMMNFMEGYNLQPSDSNTANMYHRFIEASKFAFAQQQFLGDPDFNDVHVSINNATNIMISKDVASQHRKITTNVTQQDPSVYGATTLSALDGGTSHISIVDAQELMVSVTTTVNSWFGSKLMTESGILLNNQMADFNSAGTGGNQMNKIEPGKRPLSNMSPTILYNTDHACKLRVNLGAAGGHFIPSGVVETLFNVVSLGKSLTSAIQAPRMAYQLDPPMVMYEEGIKQSIIDNLKARGHKMEKTTDILSIVQGVKKVMDKVEAYADNRKGGHAATFNNH